MQPAPEFGRAAEDYARHRAGFPPSFYDQLVAHGVDLAGADLVDLGTGTGGLARGFAARGARVTGVDPDARMLAAAAGLAVDENLDITWVAAAAEHTGLPAGAFDRISAGQCWHWFDGPAAAAEVRRLLRPEGVLVIAHLDWTPVPGNVVEATERLIEAHNPAWHLGGGNGFHGDWAPGLRAAGFRGLASFSYDVDVPYSPDAWRGRIRASAGVGASLSAAEVTRFDQALAELLARRFPGEVLAVPHHVWVLLARVGGCPPPPPFSSRRDNLPA